MTPREKWLVAFGRGWINRFEIEDSSAELHGAYVQLAAEGELLFNLGVDCVKLKEEVNE